MTIALIALTLATTVLAYRLGTIHNHLVEHLDRQTAHLQGVIAMSQQGIVNRVVAQLSRAKEEIIGKLTELQTQIDNGVPAEELDLGPLTDLAQALDDVVLDAPVAPPADAPVDPAV